MFLWKNTCLEYYPKQLGYLSKYQPFEKGRPFTSLPGEGWNSFSSNSLTQVIFCETLGLIAVITVEPADKISFVYNWMQTRLRGQYNGKWPISLVRVSRPLITVITAIRVSEESTKGLSLLRHNSNSSAFSVWMQKFP